MLAASARASPRARRRMRSCARCRWLFGSGPGLTGQPHQRRFKGRKAGVGRGEDKLPMQPKPLNSADRIEENTSNVSDGSTCPLVPCMRLGTAAPRWGGATRRHRTEHSVYHASSPCRRVWALLVSKYTRLHAWHMYVLVRYPAHTNLLAGLHRIERHGRGEPPTPSPGKMRHGLVPNHESLQQLPQCQAGRDY